MKIALITIQNANNYGGVLQTCATQKIFERYGEVDAINYENRHLSRSLDLIRIKLSFHGLLGMGKDIIRIFPRYKAIKKFKKFLNNRINLTGSFSYEDLKSGKAGNYDVYIAGSDQVWNPECVSDNKTIDNTYFLEFVANKTKKISYASSVGGYEFSEREAIKVKSLLTSFNHISVREMNTQHYLAKLLGKEIQHVVDPTLLLSKQEWLESLNIEYKNDAAERYMLLYTVQKAPLVKKQ